MPRRSLPRPERARGVTAVLGPTNTGKTHLAIERLVAHSSGMIGLPLRLLAREVYGRVVEKVGSEAVALVTGEEKIKPDRARYWIATVEAMPRDLDVAFVAIDEIQLAADLDRGHVFTDRLLNQRGREETLVIGSATMRPLVESLLPGVNVVTRPRLSNLSFAGDKKLSRLPARSAIVAFSAEEVYAIAELIRRHRGGAAVVLGALSPRTRNAQVALYQAGDVDYLVATDAIGMGLNLDVGHVAFASRQKYDGFQFRDLHPAELGQIAGRAGRHLRDGAFGSTGRCEPFDPETIDRVENHRFDPVRVAQWRSADLDFGSVERLLASLGEVPQEPGLTRALTADDEAALGQLAREDETRRLAQGRDAVEKLWEVCALPDYRRVSPVGHADLVGGIYGYLMKDGRVPSDWFARQLATVDRTDGEIDTLSQRLAHVRTWSFVANRPDWLPDPEHWQGVTRRVEDNLSDALHERLAARFVDRRTSVLMRRLRENRAMEAEISSAGDVTVEGQHVGHLHGFHFIPDAAVEGAEAKAALRNAAGKALAGELEGRAVRFGSAPDATIVLSNDGTLRWTGDPIAKLEPGDKVYDPSLRIIADEAVSGPARETIEVRLRAWLKAYIVRLLGPAMELENAAELTGLARGIAFQLSEGIGILERSRVAQDLRSLDQAGRAALRAKGVRFGAYHVYMPALIKPAPRILAAQLWALKNGGLDQRGIDELAHLAGSGRTSFPVDPEINRGLYRAAGFRAFPTRAVRVDILERLADLIRPAVAYRPGVTPGEPPPGTADGDGFVATGSMTSLVGTSGDDFGAILRALGYVAETRTGSAITVPLVPARAVAPASAETAPAPTSEATEAGGLAPVPTLPPEAAGSDAAVDTTSIEPPPSDPNEPSDADDPDPTVQEDAPDELPPAQRALIDGALEDAADRILAEAAPPEAASTGDTTADDIETSGEADEAAPPAGPIVEVGPIDEADEPAPSVQDEPDAAPLIELEATHLADPSPDEIAAAAPLLGPESAVAGPDAPADLDAAGEPDTDLARTPDDEARAIMAAAGPDVPEAAEPVTIEVWRLHRPSRGARPAGRQGRRPDAREGRPEDRRSDRRPGPPPAGEQRAGPPRGGEGRPRPGGFGRPRGGPPRPGQPPDGGAPAEAGAAHRRPEHGERFGGRRDGGGRPPRPRDERPRPEPRPERRERPADPNSPFAALAALKAQLEAKERDGR